MPALPSFDYATVRVVPRVEREEFVNAGVILLCLERDFLGARVELDPARVRALFPARSSRRSRSTSRRSRASRPAGRASGPIGRLTARERFHWLVAPRSTVIQVSPVHTGVCEDPERALEALIDRMVRPAREAP